MRSIATLVLAFLALSPVAECSDGPQDKADHHSAPAMERYHRFDTQHVPVAAFRADGWVLAIGGGGEGIIGQLAGDQTVAVDISRRELEEAAPGPLKVVMDARDLAFIDESFAAAASFFTLCYIDGGDHPKVLAEAFRVLESGGRLHIWDMVLGERPGDGKDRALMPLEVQLPGRTVNTGYGVPWPEVPHDLPYYAELAKGAGFRVVVKEQVESWFRLELEKP